MLEGSFWELSLIFLVALVVFGPERLPGLARSVGLWVGKARAVMRNFNEQIERELAVEEMRRNATQDPAKPPDASSGVKRDGP